MVGNRQSIAGIDYGKASDVVGHLEEGAAGVLAGVDALETGLDAGDADLLRISSGGASSGAACAKNSCQ